jgi:transcriptional/translational regulatory protein YebC/TACO1
MFDNKGIIVIEKDKYNYDELMEFLLEQPIIDIIEDDDTITVETDANKLIVVTHALNGAGYDDLLFAETKKVSDVVVEDLDDEQLEKVEEFINFLMDNQDVNDVHTNLKLS